MNANYSGIYAIQQETHEKKTTTTHTIDKQIKSAHRQTDRQRKTHTHTRSLRMIGEMRTKEEKKEERKIALHTLLKPSNHMNKY